MSILQKLFLIFFLSLILFALTDSFAVARELEITYPAVGGILGPSSTRTLLPDYVKYIFNFAIAISSLVVFGVMVYAGFRYVTSAGNPTTMSDAKDRIISAIIGLIIILASYLLLTTINPQLVVINPILGTNEGVIVYDNKIWTDKGNKTSCELGLGSPESQNDLKPDVHYIKFGVSSASLEKLNDVVGAVYLYQGSDKLKVYLYSQKNWTGEKKDITGMAGNCVSVSPTTYSSVELDWQNPGVYLCKDAQAKECSVYSGSQPKLANGFEDEIKYIKFKNPYAYDPNILPEDCSKKGGTYFPEQKTCGYFTQKYGAILHEHDNYEGTCKEFFNNSDIIGGSDNIFPGSNGVSSIGVFLQADKDTQGKYKIEEGAEITLCKNTECLGAECSTPNCDSDLSKITEGASTILRYGSGIPERPQGIYYSSTGEFPKFSDLKWQNPNIKNEVNDKVMAIKIKGNLKSILFWDAGFKNSCEVLNDDDPNLDKKTGNTVGNEVSSLKIIPVKK